MKIYIYLTIMNRKKKKKKKTSEFIFPFTMATSEWSHTSASHVFSFFLSPLSLYLNRFYTICMFKSFSLEFFHWSLTHFELVLIFPNYKIYTLLSWQTIKVPRKSFHLSLRISISFYVSISTEWNKVRLTVSCCYGTLTLLLQASGRMMNIPEAFKNIIVV